MQTKKKKTWTQIFNFALQRVGFDPRLLSLIEIEIGGGDWRYSGAHINVVETLAEK